MSATVGFVILTHDKPKQALRLVSRLNSMFDQPPIAWHHDFTACDLQLESVTKNISLVLPHIRTGWGKFSVVDAMIIALEILFKSRHAPDWFVLLSGADYPIKSASTIIHDLSTSQFDVHMYHKKISYNSYEREWQRFYYYRYCGLKFRIPFINRRLRPTMRTILLRHPIFAMRRTPFNEHLTCFGGDFWFSATRAAAEYLVEYHKAKPELSNFYRKQDKYVINPEESYHHTVLGNAHFRISENNWRYADWSEGNPHPKILLMKDFTQMRNSTAHFARKFDAGIDEAVLDALDECLV